MKQSKARQRIVETATELFYSKGYNLTGINEIIKEADVAKATLYSHFDSKEEICIAYLHYKDEVFRNSLETFLEQYSDDKHKLLGLFDFLDSFFIEDDFNGCWCINTISELPKENEKIRKVIQSQKKALLTLIEGYSAKLNKSEASSMARKIYILYEGAIAESHLHGDSWPIDAAREMCRNLLK